MYRRRIFKNLYGSLLTEFGMIQFVDRHLKDLELVPNIFIAVSPSGFLSPYNTNMRSKGKRKEGGTLLTLHSVAEPRTYIREDPKS